MGPLALGVIVFTFVFMIQQVFRFVDLLLNSGVPWWMATELIGSMLPAALTLSIPVSILVAILMSMGRLSAEREILAIRMSGVNLISIVWPIWFFGGLISVLMIWANFTLVPYLTLKTSDLATQIQFVIINNIPANRVYEFPESGGRKTSVVFEYRDAASKMNKINMRSTIAPDNIDEISKELDELKTSISLEKKSPTPDKERLLLYEARQKELTAQTHSSREVFITAKTGFVTQNIAERLIQVELENGEVSVSDDKDTATMSIIGFEKLTKGFSPRFERMRTGVWRKRPIEMTVPELIRKLHEANTAGEAEKETARDLWPELWSRFSLPFACLAFALIAVPLGIFMRPTGKVIPFSISFALILLYYGLLQFGRTMAQDGTLLGMFAVFLPNLLLGVAGAVMIWRMTLK